MATKTSSARPQGWLDPSLSRRSFLKASSAAAALAATSTLFRPRPAEAVTTGGLPADPIENDGDIVYSVCLQCHGGCGIRAKVKDGVLVKIDGNPYHPNAAEVNHRLAYTTPRADSIHTLGSVCVKGQAGVQTLNNPYRLLHPLKRAAGRGAGKWEVISLNTALDAVAQAIAPYFQKTVASTSLTPAQAAVAADAANYIDTDFPELGGKANQVVFSPGRFEHGQKEFADRLLRYGFGTVNYRHDHTSICETSHHVAHALMYNGKDHLKPDIVNSEFCIAWGANPLEANFPMQAYSRKFMTFRKNGGKLVVIDPRFSNSAAVADQWLPIQPGHDAALAMGMINRIITSNTYDAAYLKRPHAGAVNPGGETTFSDATYLVDTTANGGAGAFAKSGSGNEQVIDAATGNLVEKTASDAGLLDPSDTQLTTAGLDPATHQTVFQLLAAEAAKHTLAEWAHLADPTDQVITEAVISDLADQFTAHGKKAGIEFYRGTVQHTNGTYTAMAILALNNLIGNIDWKGGMAGGGSHWHEVDDKKAGMINLKSDVGGTKQSANGIQITRVGKEYEGDAPNLFAADGYPAKRPWFPFAAFGNYQELLPSIGDQYPYACKALLSYWNNTPYSVPATRDMAIEILKDEAKLPFHVCFDYEMGEMASLADIVIPDGCYLERYSTPHVAPSILTKTSGFRQPVVGSYDRTKKGWEYPYSHPLSPDIQMIEDLIIAIAHKTEQITGQPWPGIGDNTFSGSDAPDTDGKRIDNAGDYYEMILDNLRIESGKPANNDEIRAKGGVFEDDAAAYDADGVHVAHRWGGQVHFFIDYKPAINSYGGASLVATRNSMDGSHHTGLPTYVDPEQDMRGNSYATEGSGTNAFKLLTYKPVFHAQGRTIINPWLVDLMPDPMVQMNRVDADRLGLRTGEKVKITSTHPGPYSRTMGDAADPFLAFRARLEVTEGIRPGCISIPHSYGHWQMSSQSREVLLPSGVTETVAGDASRAAGVSSSPVTRLDTSVGVYYPAAPQDPVGGSAAFYDSFVTVAKL